MTVPTSIAPTAVVQPPKKKGTPAKLMKNPAQPVSVSRLRYPKKDAAFLLGISDGEVPYGSR